MTIPRQDDTGFDVAVDAEAYGLCPFAGDWHGAPWDDGAHGEGDEDLCIRFMVRNLGSAP